MAFVRPPAAFPHGMARQSILDILAGQKSSTLSARPLRPRQISRTLVRLTAKPSRLGRTGALRVALSGAGANPIAIAPVLPLRWRGLATSPSGKEKEKEVVNNEEEEGELRESPYTVPNALTIARILACPFLGYNIIHGNYEWATGILLVGGFSDWLDGWIARRWKVKSVLGSILDPAADKALMTTLVATLAWAGLLPLPLAILIFGRDFGLSISAFYFRYISLPRPRTLKRYFDPSIPSAEVKPTQISKINTALQLLLMGVTTISPLVNFPISVPLTALQWTVAGTTIWSGFSYIGRSGVKILQPRRKQ